MLQSTAPQFIGGVAVVFLPESVELSGQPACLVIRSSKSYATLLLTFRGLPAGLSAIGIRASGPETAHCAVLGWPKRLAFAGASFASWLGAGNGPDIATRDDCRETLKRWGRVAAGF